MSSSHNYPLIPRLLFLLAGAFILGGQAGKLHSWQKTQATSASLLSESTSWGLSFQKEGERPVGNATINALGKYHAYYAEDTNERKIYLTFDAGYENGNTPRILDALKKHQAPATFFVVGNFISDNPDLIRRMVSEGHTVGNHTMTHPDMSGISSKDDFLKQLNGVEELYESVTGEKMSKFYRPPQGIYSTSNLALAQELGYSTFFWSLAYVDLVIPEENWEQKRTDVKEYHVDTFVMGDDWKGKFDFLKEEGCEVVYLPRTPEISSSQIKEDLHTKESKND